MPELTVTYSAAFLLVWSLRLAKNSSLGSSLAFSVYESRDAAVPGVPELLAPVWLPRTGVEKLSKLGGG